jgi:hypothetical protein
MKTKVKSLFGRLIHCTVLVPIFEKLPSVLSTVHCRPSVSSTAPLSPLTTLNLDGPSTALYLLRPSVPSTARCPVYGPLFPLRPLCHL